MSVVRRWLVALLVSLATPAGATNTTVTYPVHVNPAIVLGNASFRSPNIGTPSASQTIIVTNTGPTAVPFTGPTITGANATDFALLSSTCVSPLNSSASCRVTVTYTASAVGVETATLQVSGTSGHIYSSALNGTTAAPTAITLVPSNTTIVSGTSAGVVVSTAVVTTSDGSPYVGNLSTDRPDLFAISGLNIVTARAIQDSDAGSVVTVITAN